jgi:hypothetical protein
VGAGRVSSRIVLGDEGEPGRQPPVCLVAAVGPVQQPQLLGGDPDARVAEEARSCRYLSLLERQRIATLRERGHPVTGAAWPRCRQRPHSEAEAEHRHAGDRHLVHAGLAEATGHPPGRSRGGAPHVPRSAWDQCGQRHRGGGGGGATGLLGKSRRPSTPTASGGDPMGSSRCPASARQVGSRPSRAGLGPTV